jgi:hypothetical protein
MTITSILVAACVSQRSNKSVRRVERSAAISPCVTTIDTVGEIPLALLSFDDTMAATITL